MAANVESLFSVREVPWHGLGTIVKEAPNSKEAIEIAGLNWKVESKPVFTEAGKEIPGYFSNVRNSDESVLGIVGSRYKIVQNDEAFEFTDSLISGDVKYETAGSLNSGKKVWLLAKMPEQSILGDKFDPYICFTNTFDGSGSIKVCMTPIRVVCNNTLNIALKEASRSWSMRHVGDIKGKLEEARQVLGLADIYMKRLEEEADKLANVKVSEDEVEYIITSIFPINFDKDSPRKIENMNFMKDEFMKCYNADDIKQFKSTAYGVVNAASDFVGHTQPRRLTNTYQENNWGKIMFGHPVFDKFYNLVSARAA